MREVMGEREIRDSNSVLALAVKATGHVAYIDGERLLAHDAEQDSRITALEALARDVARLPVQWDADTTYHLIHRAQALVPPQEPGR